jgi:hypothetical protein
MRRAALALASVLSTSGTSCIPSDAYTDRREMFLEAFPRADVPLPRNGRVVFGWQAPEPDDDVVIPAPEALSFEQVPPNAAAPVLLDSAFVGDGVTELHTTFVVDPLDVGSDAIAIDAHGLITQRAEFATADVEDDEAPPVTDVTIAAAFPLDDASGYQIAIDTPLTDSEPFLLRIAGDADAFVLPPRELFNSAGPVRFTVRVPGLEARRWCVGVFAVDVAGNETALATDLCVALDGG